MAMGFIIYPDFRLLFIRGHGVMTQSERIGTMLAWLADPGYPACVDAMFDVSAAESTPKIAELRELISILRQRAPANGPRRLAIITSKPIAFGVAGIFGQLLRLKGFPLEVRAFLHKDAAWAWLRPDMAPLEFR
jgi:hypothetical protein